MSDATNVTEALCLVMRDLPGIGKDGTAAPSQGGYHYRGIEQITAQVQKLFAKHGVVVIPKVQAREVADIVVNDKPWTDTYLEVNWLICGPGGPEDSLLATTFGHGRDNSDKGTNKAMTQAFKYLLLDMLCISDPADDNDGTNIGADARRFPAHAAQPTYQQVNGEDIPLDVPMETQRSGPPSTLATPKQATYCKALLLGAGLNDEEKLTAWFAVNDLGAWPGGVNNLSKTQAQGVIERLRP